MKKIFNLTLVVFVAFGIFFSCTVDIPSTPAVEETDYSGIGRNSVIPEVDCEVKYEVIDSYFVGNVEEGKHYLVIDNLEKFNHCFSPAAVMWTPQRWVTAADFTDNLIIAVVEPAEYYITDYTLEELALSNDTLEFKYRSEKISTPGTQFRFCKILLVKKEGYKNVSFIENGLQKAKIPVL